MAMENHFGAGIAATYDDDHAGHDGGDLDAAVALLGDLAGDGRVLEFAIGTGRVALPLAAKGIEIHGIEFSSAMVEKMRAKPGGREIPVTIGDMARTQLDARFSLVFLVFNTITNLVTQQAQVACFRNAAKHLRPGGYFLIEVFIPPLQRLPFGETLVPFARAGSQGHWGFDEVDVATQSLTSHHFRAREGGMEKISVPFRYVWPSELDLMAELAGLTLKSRWATWRKEPFTARSFHHISVWQKPVE